MGGGGERLGDGGGRERLGGGGERLGGGGGRLGRGVGGLGGGEGGLGLGGGGEGGLSFWGGGGNSATGRDACAAWVLPVSASLFATTSPESISCTADTVADAVVAFQESLPLHTPHASHKNATGRHSRSVRVMVVREGHGQTARPVIEAFHRCCVCTWFASATLMLFNVCAGGGECSRFQPKLPTLRVLQAHGSLTMGMVRINTACPAALTCSSLPAVKQQPAET